jgi:iron complex transport system ATP-binding protein
VIEVRDAGVAFGAKWVFRHLSLDLGAGEILAILGRNGQGKTTLLRGLVGLQSWSEGRAKIDGTLGYVPQSPTLPFAYSVLDIVLTGRARHVKMFAVPGRADREAARAALHALGISRFADRRIDELSGGERQLVLIARALASECTLLILDEPTSALDFRNQDMILATLRNFSHERGLTIVFASHYPQHAIHVADKVLLMHDVDDYAFGETQAIMTEAALSRLYDIPIRKVNLVEGDAPISTMVPLFSS